MNRPEIGAAIGSNTAAVIGRDTPDNPRAYASPPRGGVDMRSRPEDFSPKRAVVPIGPGVEQQHQALLMVWIGHGKRARDLREEAATLEQRLRANRFELAEADALYSAAERTLRAFREGVERDTGQRLE